MKFSMLKTINMLEMAAHLAQSLHKVSELEDALIFATIKA